MATRQTSTTKNKSNDFLVQGSILAVAGIIVRIIGLAYRIPLIRIIGDEGMGYYSVAFEIYSVILLLSSYSLPLAVSKMISARIASEDYVNAHRIFKVSLLYATVVGGVGCIFVWLSADWFANVFYMLPLCKYALISLAPTIWVMAYLGVMRGYYQGQSTMVPTALSQILEQIANAIVSVGAAWWLCEMALKAAKSQSEASAWGAAGGTIGTGAGALTALIVLIVLYVKGKKDWKENVDQSILLGKPTLSYKQISKVLFLTVIPVILSTAVYNISGIIDSEIFSTTMVDAFGKSASDVAAQYGAYTGKFKTIVNIPIAIANSLSSSLIPVMARAAAENDDEGVKDGISRALKFTVLIALPASVGLTVLGGPAITLLFGNSALAVSMTYVGSFAILFYSVSTVTNAVLQGNNYMRLPFIHAVIALVLHILALIFMLRVLKLGVQSVVIAYMLFALLMCVFNAISKKQKLGYKADIMTIYIKPLICAAVMGIATFVTRYLIETYVTKSSLIVTGVCMVVALVVYAAMILATKCIPMDELKKFPVIKKFIK